MSNEADVWWKPTHQRAAKSIAQFTISESFHRPPPPPSPSPGKRASKRSSGSPSEASQPGSPDSPLQIIAQVALSDDPLPSDTPSAAAASPALPSRKRARPGTTLSDPPPPHKKKLSSAPSPPASGLPPTPKRAGRPRKNPKNSSHDAGPRGALAETRQIPSGDGRVRAKIPGRAKAEQEEGKAWGDDERGIILSIFGSLYPSDENSDDVEAREDEDEEDDEEGSSELALSGSDEDMSDVAHTDDSSASDYSEPGSPFLSSEEEEEEEEEPKDATTSHLLEDELLALSLPRTRSSPRNRHHKPSLSTISAQIDAITASQPPKRGRGRPRKNALPLVSPPSRPAARSRAPPPPRKKTPTTTTKRKSDKTQEVFNSTTDEETSDDGASESDGEDPDFPLSDDDAELQSDDTEDEDETGDPNKPPPYGALKRNVYVGIKPPKEVRSEQCQCWYLPNIPDMACGTNCMNRLGLEECYPNNCPCGEHCMNQRFQKLQYSDLKVVRTNKKGFGVLAQRDIARGEFVIEYVGEVIDHDVFLQRMKMREGQKNYYIITVGSGRYVDATYKGNIARFINHSCEPNCKPEIWHVRGHRCVGIFALKDIKAGEEVTFDYQFERIGSAKQKCYCGQPTCRGFLGARKPIAARPPKSPTADAKEKGKGKGKGGARGARRKGTPTRAQPQAKPTPTPAPAPPPPPPPESYDDTPLPLSGPTTRRSWTRMLHSATQNSLEDLRKQQRRSSRRSSGADAL